MMTTAAGKKRMRERRRGDGGGDDDEQANGIGETRSQVQGNKRTGAAVAHRRE